MKIIDVVTKRQDTLCGCWYGENFRDTIVIITNGSGGDVFANRFLRVVGEQLEEKGISFIYAHNSGAFQIMDLPSQNKKRCGLTFEMFDDCLVDIAAYVEYVEKLGYENIVLAGHSLGANKIIYYLSRHKPRSVVAYALLSPPDMAHEITTIDDFDELIKEAKTNITNGEPDKLLSKLVWDYYILSSARFIDLVENKHAQNLPITSKKGSFDDLKSIKLPLLAVAGERDDSCSDNVGNYLLELTKQADFNAQYAIIRGAGHTYRNHELDLFNAIYSFLLANI